MTLQFSLDEETESSWKCLPRLAGLHSVSVAVQLLEVGPKYLRSRSLEKSCSLAEMCGRRARVPLVCKALQKRVVVTERFFSACLQNGWEEKRA